MIRSLNRALALGLLAAAIGCNSNSPSQETTTFTAQISPANEVPPVTNTESGGSGTATIVFKVVRDNAGAISSATADFQVSLSTFPIGTTLTMSHIHRGAIGTNGSIVVDTGLTSGEVVFTTTSQSFNKLGIAMTPALAQEILSNPAGFYFNVHTVVNPSGVARGQLVKQ